LAAFGSTAWLAAIAAIVWSLVACDTGGTTSQPSPSGTPSAQAWPTGGPLAVYDSSPPDASSHTVSVVGFNNAGGLNETAKVLASVTVAERTPIPFKCMNCFATDPLYVSTSRSHIYVLDGDATVRMLAPDGSLTTVTSLPGTRSARAAFAVSPDDSQIAVGLIDFDSLSSRLYVEQLRGGGRVDVFTKSGGYFNWPIGWRGSQIVLATGPNTGTFRNPNEASGYALIDANAGAQPVALGTGDCVPVGTVNGAGTACLAHLGSPCLEDPVSDATSTYYYSCLRRISWSGSETNFLLPSNAYTNSFKVGNAALSPDGQVIMTDQLGRVLAPVSNTHGGNAFLGSSSLSGQANLRMGWISNELFSTTVVSTDGTSTQSIVALNPPDYNATRGVPFAGATPIGSLVGTLPGGL